MKPRKCKVCRAEFLPSFNTTQRVCGVECSIAKAKATRLAAERVVAKKDRRETREKLEKLKTRTDWVKDAQKAFNAYIRARDARRPCICCGRPFEPHRPGGAVDAGHYLSVGSSPHLRFEEANVHAQRKSCNRPGGTSRVSFRNGMIERIGLAALEALESDQAPRHYSIDDLKALKATYTAKRRELDQP